MDIKRNIIIASFLVVFFPTSLSAQTNLPPGFDSTFSTLFPSSTPVERAALMDILFRALPSSTAIQGPTTGAERQDSLKRKIMEAAATYYPELDLDKYLDEIFKQPQTQPNILPADNLPIRQYAPTSTPVLASPPPAALPQSSRNIFTRNLKQGDQGEDVRMLQRLLNSDPQIRVAKSGPGSLGNETDFFGARTQFAVIAFQNKYRKEILAPAGLSVGTGFVGQYTRTKLNALLYFGGMSILE